MHTQGLKENISQFLLLVIVNVFVGAMIGIERSLMPALARDKFLVEASLAISSFVFSFGISKAAANYLVGPLSHYLTKKQLLLFGWLFALPVPLLIIYADSWNTVVMANILLGINQGLTWSAAVLLKIDLVGERNRGLAMGLNEFAGYFAVGLTGYLSAEIALVYNNLFLPFYGGILLAGIGLLLSLLVKDTAPFVHNEVLRTSKTSVKNVFAYTIWQNSNLASTTQAGFINNLNDALMWLAIPIWMTQQGYSLSQTGIVAGIYPAVWGIGQLITGKLGDHFCKKNLIVIGMSLQGIAIIGLLFTSQLWPLIALSAMVGIGTALVYPSFLATIADNTHPEDRTKSIGVFRFFRDLGYPAGAFITGFLLEQNADARLAFLVIGGLTLLSGALVAWRMYCLSTAIESVTRTESIAVE